ncbi:hypothetical protein VTI74DRAFT_4668 [Chaetomium olivicolor]
MGPRLCATDITLLGADSTWTWCAIEWPPQLACKAAAGCQLQAAARDADVRIWKPSTDGVKRWTGWGSMDDRSDITQNNRSELRLSTRSEAVFQAPTHVYWCQYPARK